MNVKYIFITGGVVSSLGKGLTAASMALLLECRGAKVAMLKLDPYLNVDPGTMNPFQHGEVYVTEDGAETDLDLGHYERFTHAIISKNSSATSGQIYESVIKRERRGDYLGQTVQIIPHITDEIKQRIYLASNHGQKADIVIVEIGGTVGDIESLPFLEAIRQFRHEHAHDCLNIHLTYVPFLEAAKELKTKPTQHSVQTLRSIGIVPDLILCRSEVALETPLKEKIALFCSVKKEHVIDVPDIEGSIYKLPLILKERALDEVLCRLLKLDLPHQNLAQWKEIIDKIDHPKHRVRIGLVGKYVELHDAYKSVFEALFHAGIANETEVKIIPFESDNYKIADLKTCDGILVPGGFGRRGFEGKIEAARFCRENLVPYFGICLGMQVLCVEQARHVGLTAANSTEIDPETPHPIISLLSEQKDIKGLGGTMRLGSYTCELTPGSRLRAIYGAERVDERHRHRYEFNNRYAETLKKAGLNISGHLAEQNLCETVESESHPWMIGVQFHPEFKSKPTSPHPLFRDFIAAALKYKTGETSGVCQPCEVES